MPLFANVSILRVNDASRSPRGLMQSNPRPDWTMIDLLSLTCDTRQINKSKLSPGNGEQLALLIKSASPEIFTSESKTTLFQHHALDIIKGMWGQCVKYQLRPISDKLQCFGLCSKVWRCCRSFTRSFFWSHNLTVQGQQALKRGRELGDRIWEIWRLKKTVRWRWSNTWRRDSVCGELFLSAA